MGSTPYKDDDYGLFISRVTEGGPADIAGLKVGDKVLKANDVLLVNPNHHDAVKFLRNCGNLLVLVVEREVTRFVGHPIFHETSGVLTSQVNIKNVQFGEKF